MRIILVNKFHYMRGGSETYHLGLAEGLRRLGHEVHIFAMQDPRNLPCEDSELFVSPKDYNAPTSIAKRLGEAMSLIYSKESLEKFQALCERVRPDVVHMSLVHRQITLSILDAPYMAEHRVPVLFTSHDYILVCPNYLMLDSSGNVCEACLGGRFSNCLRRRCVKGSWAKSAMAMLEAGYYKRRRTYSRINRIIAPSEFMRKKLVEGGFSEWQVVSMQNFAKDEVLERARLSEDLTDYESPYLLFFGRLSREKGVDVLVKAFLCIAKAIPGWRLVIAGDGPERSAIEGMLSSSPQGRRVELVGYLDQAEVQRYAERASLTVTSSRWRENMPYSIIEAFAAGTPVVGTKIGGIPELVIEGETGFVCEPGDVGSLYEAIMRGIVACGDTGRYHDMQRRCRQYVLERCDQGSYMKSLVSLYESLKSSEGDKHA